MRPLPPSELRDRVLAEVQTARSPVRRERRIRDVIVLAGAFSGALLIFLHAGGLRAAPRPPQLILETALGAAFIASLAWWVIAARGHSMLGRSHLFIAVASLLTPLLLFAWKVLVSAQDPANGVAWPERPGFQCLRLDLEMGLLPLVGLIVLYRGSEANWPYRKGAALGVAAGAWAWVFTDLWCPVAFVPHLLLGHVLPLSLLATLGALLGGPFLAIHARQP